MTFFASASTSRVPEPFVGIEPGVNVLPLFVLPEPLLLPLPLFPLPGLNGWDGIVGVVGTAKRVVLPSPWTASAVTAPMPADAITRITAASTASRRLLVPVDGGAAGGADCDSGAGVGSSGREPRIRGGMGQFVGARCVFMVAPWIHSCF